MDREIEDNTKFRGNWSPQINSPTAKKFHYVAPPAQIRKRTDENGENIPTVEVKITKERAKGPPDGADVKLNIRDRYNDYRGYISGEGTCYNCLGDVIGYIEGESAGSVEMDYLGTINQGNQIENEIDEIVGELDPGRATLRDRYGTTVCELNSRGEARGEDGSYLGRFEGFSYHDMRIIAVYLFLIDPTMLATYDED